jgi:peptidoglycan-N-acetylglucosamine deacetylase
MFPPRAKRAAKDVLQTVLTRRSFLWKARTREPAVALTFDDGPDPVHTPAVLDILAAHGAKATFFLIGKNAFVHQDLVRRIVAEGHQVANHTWSHRRLDVQTYGRVAEELDTTRDFLATIVGEPTRMYRPPRGQMSPKLLCYTTTLGYTTVLWTVSFSDYRRLGTEFITSQFESADLGPGGIVLLHDNNPYTVDALDPLLRHLQQRNLSAVTLRELLD